MFFRPLGVRDPDTLFRFQRRSPQNYSTVVPYPEMAFFREHSATLSAVIGVTSGKLAMEGEPKQINISFVTPNIFQELGIPAALGRAFDANDTAPVIILGYGFWERHFGSDPLVVGKMVHINAKLATVIGVAPQDFSGLSNNAPDM